MAKKESRRARQRSRDASSGPTSRPNPRPSAHADANPTPEAPQGPVNVYERPSGLRRYPTWLIVLLAILVVALVVVVSVFLI